MAKIIVIGSNAESLIIFRKELLKEFVKLKNNVIACSPTASVDIQQKIHEIGVVFKEIPFKRVGLNPFSDFINFIILVKLFKQFKPDIVLAYTIKPVIYASICARLTKIKLMTSMITGLGYAFSCDSPKKMFVNIIAIFLYKIGLRNNKIIFFQNIDDLNFFKSARLITSRNTHILINGSGVDLDLFYPKKLPSNISFLLIARLIIDKGIREYIEAAKIIKHKYPKIKFRLVGSIDKNPNAITPKELERWVQEGIVECLGYLDDVRPVIEDTSVYILPSYREGTPRSTLEAMAMGRAVVTTDVPGCRETVTPGVNGILVPPRDHVALAAAMELFILQPELIATMGAASRRLAEEKFDVREVNRIILQALGLRHETTV